MGEDDPPTGPCMTSLPSVCHHLSYPLNESIISCFPSTPPHTTHNAMSTASTNTPFSPPTLLRLIAASIPTPAAAAQLNTPHDAIALLVHACMLSVGFRLVGLGEDGHLGASTPGGFFLSFSYFFRFLSLSFSISTPPPLLVMLTKLHAREEVPSDESDPKPLSPDWNAAAKAGNYGFRYSHPQSAMQFLIKCNRLGSRTVIMGLGLGDDKTASFDIATSDFTSQAFFPHTLQPHDDNEAQLKTGFISESRMADLASLVKINIVQKLAPAISKPGYHEERAPPPTGGNGGQASAPARPQPRADIDDAYRDPLRVPRPYGDLGGLGGLGRGPPIPAGGETIPGFDDEYEILRPPHQRPGPGFGSGGSHPLGVGADDLNPPGLGPLRGRFFGEGGPAPGGMHPTPDHPMFGGRGGGAGGGLGGMGR